MLTDGALLQNRYRILRTLSDKGGMGIVYQAEDQRLGSAVVVKETRHLPLKFDVRDRALKAFFREARLLANLRHAALPRVTDYFVEGDGHFLVMEFIPGKDLQELLDSRGKASTVEDALRWADRLLEVLEYLHGHNEPIIHRDSKPANLKLTPRGEVMLLDFGLAKGAAIGIEAASSLYGYTPQYAPLEQIKGAGTDARSDLFSLAATLYHLLTGQAPPDAVERVAEVAMGNPDPLKPVAELNRSVPANISSLISVAMALKPDDRPATATAMRQALRESKRAPQSTIIDEAATIVWPEPQRKAPPSYRTLTVGEPVLKQEPALFKPQQFRRESTGVEHPSQPNPFRAGQLRLSAILAAGAVFVIALAIYLATHYGERSLTKLSTPTPTLTGTSTPASGATLDAAEGGGSFTVPPGTSTPASGATLDASASPTPSPTPEAPARAMRVRLTAPLEDVWLKVRADDKEAEEILLQPGESREFDVNEQIILSVGRVQSLRVAINGRKMDFVKLLPNPKALIAIDVVITKDNYQQFLN